MYLYIYCLNTAHVTNENTGYLKRVSNFRRHKLGKQVLNLNYNNSIKYAYVAILAAKLLSN